MKNLQLKFNFFVLQVIDEACFSKQDLQIFATCAQSFLNSPKNTTSSFSTSSTVSLSHSGKNNSMTISSSVSSIDLTMPESNIANSSSGRGFTKMVSMKEFGVKERSVGQGKRGESETEGARDGEDGADKSGNKEGARDGEDGADKSGNKEGADDGENGADKSGDKEGWFRDEAGVTLKKELKISEIRAIALGENGNPGSLLMTGDDGGSDSMVSVNAKFIGPAGMSLEFRSEPKTFDGKLTDRLISIEPERLTVTEPAMYNKVLEKKKEINNKLTEYLPTKIRCSYSIIFIKSFLSKTSLQ